MTEREAEQICKLIKTKEQHWKLTDSDDRILKSIIYNDALEEAEIIIRNFAKGVYSQDVLDSLLGD